MIELINGASAIDHRGKITFVNDFDMSLVKRFYIIENKDLEVIRGWRAHKIEQRWFFVLEGAFSIKIVQIDDFSQPNKELPIQKIELNAHAPHVLHIKEGYATALQALEPNSKILVFANSKVSDAHLDDYLYPVDYFNS